MREINNVRKIEGALTITEETKGDRHHLAGLSCIHDLLVCLDPRQNKDQNIRYNHRYAAWKWHFGTVVSWCMSVRNEKTHVCKYTLMAWSNEALKLERTPYICCVLSERPRSAIHDPSSKKYIALAVLNFDMWVADFINIEKARTYGICHHRYKTENKNQGEQQPIPPPDSRYAKCREYYRGKSVAHTMCLSLTRYLDKSCQFEARRDNIYWLTASNS